jgi:uncharacterized membrane protein
MPNYAPRLPLTIDKIDGAYSLVKDLKILAQQNLKMFGINIHKNVVILIRMKINIEKCLIQ